jgi:predicted N-formylglutamate amidohydrolase
MNKDSPFHITGGTRSGRWVVSCDHASNHVPAEIPADLGMSAADMARHIAYDVGALGVTLELAKLLNSPAIQSNFSRLVIDPNRGALDPTLVMKLYDGTIIPANRHVDDVEIERRLNAYHKPYHDAFAQLASRHNNTVICAIHSFTPRLKAQPQRPWQLGILSAPDKRFTAPLIQALRNAPSLHKEAAKLSEPLVIGDNEPYIGYFPGDAIDTHATPHARPNVLIELRSDLIETAESQKHWAALLAPILEQTLEITGL